MIRVRQIKILVTDDTYLSRLKKVAKVLKVKESDILKLEIKRKAIDARDKNYIYYIYEFDCLLKNEEIFLKKLPRLNNKNISRVIEMKPRIPKFGSLNLKSRIVIVGMGPAGLFAAYNLAKYGYKPLIIEQGKKVEDRVLDVLKFFETGNLNPLSNVQFGEGGAGTFSDGKLNTLVKDKDNLIKEVFELFVKWGAPKEILYLKNPHIGTDILRKVIVNMRDEIKKLGGEIWYQTKLTDILINDNKLEKIVLNNKLELECSHLILAIGHSARDTFRMLEKKKIEITPKPFAIGVRVMHKQSLINENQYGKYANLLPPANYKLTYKTKKGRGVYSFCMCPGGFVVNASSSFKELVINGMSNYKRDEELANSAIVVTVNVSDYGNYPLAGIEYQEKLEKLTYKLGNGNIPIQLWGDFVGNKPSLTLGSVNPVIKGGYILTNIREVLPDFVTEALLEAIPEFAKKIKGFDNKDTLLAIIESRTSSPIRIKRDENYEASIKGIYPCGEGAGYAGGITTSAMDGLKISYHLIETYNNSIN